jgi:hypothetical protein
MARDTQQMALKVDLGPEALEDETDAATRSLLDELSQLDVASVDLVNAGDAPEATKGFGLIEVGSLVVKFVSSGALGKVVDAVKGWLSRDANRTVKLVVEDETIEMTGVSSEQQQQLIDQWVKSVASKLDA